MGWESNPFTPQERLVMLPQLQVVDYLYSRILFDVQSNRMKQAKCSKHYQTLSNQKFFLKLKSKVLDIGPNGLCWSWWRIVNKSCKHCVSLYGWASIQDALFSNNYSLSDPPTLSLSFHQYQFSTCSLSSSIYLPTSRSLSLRHTLKHLHINLILSSCLV